MKKLLVLSGIPGCGKSTFCEKYIKDHPDENVKIVSSDNIRYELGGSYTYFEEEPKVWHLFIYRAEEYACYNRDITVILDSTCIKNKFRKKYVIKTPDFNYRTLVFFDIPYETACIRNKGRKPEKIVPDEAMERMKNNLQVPSDEVISMYNEYIIIKD